MKERHRDGPRLLRARQETTHITSTLVLLARSSDTTPLVCSVAGIIGSHLAGRLLYP